MGILSFFFRSNETEEIEEIDEAETDTEAEPFEPFTCRKCGQVVTNPYELCEAERK